jgi:hypothetical protein
MAQNIQTLEPTQRLNITTQPQNFANVMTQIASQPTLLGMIGTTMASNASQSYQKLRGIEAGKTPGNDLLPPITEADKAFAEGYSAQAQQTLSMQAQKMLMQGQLDLNQNYKLSRGDIEVYQKNMTQGLQSIIEQAPYTIRSDLANQFSSQLQLDVYNYNNKLLTQQKTEAKENASVYQNQQLNTMYNTALSGGNSAPIETKKIYDKTLKNIEGNLASGLISPVEAETQKQAAKQTYLSSLLSADAANAKQNKNTAQFLNSLIETPSEYQGVKVTPSDWEVARQKAFNYVATLDQFSNRNQNLILSDAMVKMQETGLTSSDIAELKSTLDPEKFNTFYVSYLKTENQRLSSANNAQFVAANYTNPTIMSGLSNQQKNNAFDLHASNIYTRQLDIGKPISIQEAQYRAQAASPVPIPKYINSLAAALDSPNPQIAAESAATVQRFFDSNLGSALGTTFQQNSRPSMMQHAITNFVNGGNSAEEAVMLARQMFNQPKDKLEANQAIANQWSKRVNTPAQVATWAKNFINNPSGVIIPNQPVLQNQMKQVYMDYLVAFNGDEQMASSYMEKGMNRAYGVTRVNGRDEYMYMPIEQAAGLDEYATPLVLDDIYEQTQKQFANMKAIYDKPNSQLDFYYELKPRVTYDQYAEAKIFLQDKDKGFQPTGKTAQEITQSLNVRAFRIQEAEEQVKQYEAGNPIELEQIYRNGEKYSRFIEIVNNPFMSISTGENPTIGGYDIQMRDKDGVPVKLYGVFDQNYTYPAYVPDIQKIKDRYAGVAKIPGQPMESFESRVKNLLTSENRPGQLGAAFMAAPLR